MEIYRILLFLQFFLAAHIVCCVNDLKLRRLPNKLIYFYAAAGFANLGFKISNLDVKTTTFSQIFSCYILPILITALAVTVICIICYCIRHELIGAEDVKWLLVTSVWLPDENFAIYMAITSAVCVLWHFANRKRNISSDIPVGFGFFIAGVVLAIIRVIRLF